MALSEKELAKLKKQTMAVMCQDRQKLLVRFPYTGGFLMRLEFVPVRDCRLRTAATDGERIYMDIVFCAKLSTDELYAALPLTACGYAPEELAAASPRDMDKYYAPEDQKKWGVVGIELSFDF